MAHRGASALAIRFDLRLARRIATVTLLLGVVVGLFLLRPAGAATRQVRVYGTVLLPDGRPARNVALSIDVWRQELVQLRTGPEGGYTLNLADGRRHWLEATAPGVGISKVTTVDPGSNRRLKLDLRLRPIPVLTGTVYLPSGRPAPATVFQIFGKVSREFPLPADTRTTGDAALCVPLGTTATPASLKIRTDAQGRFRAPLLPDLAPAHLSFYGEHAQLELHPVSAEGLGWSEPIHLHLDLDRSEIHQDVQLRPGERAEGFVVGYPGGQRLGGVKVSALVDGNVWGEALTDARGHFRVMTTLEPGRYTLGADGGVGWGLLGAVPEQTGPADFGMRRYEIQLIHDARIHGQVFGPDGQPLAKTHVPTLILGHREATPTGSAGGAGDAGVDTDAEGRYTTEFKAAGGHDGGWYRASRVVTVAVRGKDMLAPPQTLDLAKTSDQEVDLHLVAPGRVQGQVLLAGSEAPAKGVSVYVLPSPAVAATWGTTRLHDYYDKDNSSRVVKADGKFDLQRIPPGDYLLVVRGCTIYETSTENGTAVPVTVAAGQTTGPLTLTVRAKPTFAGDLRGLSSKEISGLNLRCVMQRGGSERRPRAVHADLAKGGARYSASTSGFGMGYYDVVFLGEKDGVTYVTNVRHGVGFGAGGAAGDLDFTFSRGASLSGRVLRADGAPASAASVILRPVAGDARMLFPQLICGSEDPGEQFLRADLDKEGQFSFSGLLPGEYELAVGWTPSHYSPYLELKLPVTLTENEPRGGLVLKLPQA